MSKFFLIAFICFALIARLAHADHQVSKSQPQCLSHANQLASCSPNNRSFKSVVVAIHGWGGHCNVTFGDGKTTLFSHLLSKGISDVDCFEYSTAGQSIENSVQQLRKRLVDLKAAGYREFEFVTHSMGGIVFLRMLLDDLLNDDKSDLRASSDPKRFFIPDGPQLAFASIWAAPINGVSPAINSATAFREWFSSAPTYTRDALIADREFLTTLRSDMALVAKHLQNKPPEDRGKYSFRLLFHHGQSSDWVVNKIGLSEEWHTGFGNDRLKLDNSDAGHVDTVGVPGPEGMARFPIVIIKSEQLLQLTFLPRLEEAYEPTHLTQNASQLSRRERIVDGTVLLLTEAMDRAIGPLREVLVKMVASNYAHFPAQDEKLAKAMLDIAIEKASRLSADPNAKELFIRYADTLLCDSALTAFRPDAVGSTAVGGERFLARNHLLNLMALFARELKKLESQDPSLAARLTHCGSMGVVEENTMRPQIQALSAGSDSNVATGVANLEALVQIFEPMSLDAVEINKAVINFRLKKSNGLPEALNRQLGDIIVASAAKSKLQREFAMRRLAVSRVPGQDAAPYFTKILNDDQVTALNKQIDVAETRRFETDFLSRVIENAGTSGTSQTLALEAGEILIQSAQGKPIAEQTQIFKELDLSKLRAKYPRASNRIGDRIIQMQEP